MTRSRSRGRVWPVHERRATEPVLRLVVTLALCLGLAGCSGGGDTSYVFHPDDSPVNVDTPELRQAKAAAGIEDCPQSAASASQRSGGLPNVTLPCLGGGGAVDLAGLTGTPLVINIWATYCGPCRDEAPIFQQIHQLAGEDLDVLGIDWQDTRPGTALTFADQLGLTYPQLADPQAATRAPLGVSALPMTLFVDETGVITHVIKGPVTSVRQLGQLVQEHLGVRISAVS